MMATRTSTLARFEICDGTDNNCDGDTDEDSAIDAQTWYQDSDGDSFGNGAVVDIDCYQPSGYVLNGTDCDDSLLSGESITQRNLQRDRRQLH